MSPNSHHVPTVTIPPKTTLDAGLIETVFKVGDLVLLRTKELLDVTVADIGKLRQRWDGP
jgi:hypothetical protein